MVILLNLSKSGIFGPVYAPIMTENLNETLLMACTGDKLSSVLRKKRQTDGIYEACEAESHLPKI